MQISLRKINSFELGMYLFFGALLLQNLVALPLLATGLAFQISATLCSQIRSVIGRCLPSARYKGFLSDAMGRQSALGCPWRGSAAGPGARRRRSLYSGGAAVLSGPGRFLSHRQGSCAVCQQPEDCPFCRVRGSTVRSGRICVCSDRPQLSYGLRYARILSPEA